jgi:NTP pyrophosphatase (non-canonical NTP hydrolase)
MEKQFIELINKEYQRANKLFPPFKSTHEGYAVLLEEVDELWDNIKQNKGMENMKEEIVQIGAMAMKFYVNFIK